MDIFFVISGYLTARSIKNKAESGSFSYFDFILSRLKRLLPLVIVASVVSLLIGYFTMLPDDYENLSESVVASCMFLNNALAAVTTQDYWAVVNDFKPLMHTWYLGVLFQFYLVYPLLFVFFKRVEKDKRTKVGRYITYSVAVISTIIFLLPVIDAHIKFYYLPFRLFELLAGAIVCDREKFWEGKKDPHISNLLIILILVLLVWDSIPVRNDVGILGCVCAVSLILLYRNHGKIFHVIVENPLSLYIGRISFSIYIWHQVILAFYRYCISTELTNGILAALLFVTGISATVSYCVIERRSYLFRDYKICVGTIACWLITVGVSLFLYNNAGVVRDIPELDITKDNAQRNMHPAYNHRIYGYDKEFEKNEKINVLLIGNSFSRDFANILLESEMAERINISYSYEMEEGIVSRIAEANYIFINTATDPPAGNCYYEDIPSWFFGHMKEGARIYGIGVKRFGYSMGIYYARRGSAGYYSQVFEIPDDFIALNEEMKSSWKGRYIDLFSVTENGDGAIPVFTDNGKFISQDTKHLTRAGAQYYAELINWEEYFVD